MEGVFCFSRSLFLHIVSYLNSNRVQIQPPIISPYQSAKCCLTYCALKCIAKLNLVLDVIANRANIPPVKINTSSNRYISKTFDKLFNCWRYWTVCLPWVQLIAETNKTRLLKDITCTIEKHNKYETWYIQSTNTLGLKTLPKIWTKIHQIIKRTCDAMVYGLRDNFTSVLYMV